MTEQEPSWVRLLPPIGIKTQGSPGKLREFLYQLYNQDVSISEFKKLCVEDKINYENIEHCCCCAGCHESDDHGCPDYEEDDLECQLREGRYCGICMQKADIGIPMTNKKHKETSVFWVCSEHEEDPRLHSIVKPEDLNRDRRYDKHGYVLVHDTRPNPEDWSPQNT